MTSKHTRILYMTSHDMCTTQKITCCPDGYFSRNVDPENIVLGKKNDTKRSFFKQI